MNTCDICKWWIFKPADFIFKKGGTCTNEKLSNETGKLGDDELLAVGDEEGVFCPATGPKFGCIHHEPK